MRSRTRTIHWRNIRGVFRAKDGISAVEFALIAPLMMLMYFGCIELSLMMSLDRKVTIATSSLGDLVARASTISNDDLDDIFQATRMVLQPNDITQARMRISSLYDDDGTTKVAWSEGCNMSDYTDDQEVTVPANIVPSGGTVIFAEIEYDYSSSIGYLFSSSKTLSEEFYLRPRRVNEITRSEDTAYGCSGVSAG